MPERKRVVKLPSPHHIAMKPPLLMLSPSSRRGTAPRFSGSRTRLHRAAIALSLLAVLAWLPSALAQGSADNSAADSGVFLILSGNKRVGTEKFKIQPDGEGWLATGELQLQGPDGKKVTETCSLQLDGKLLPTHYERIQKSPQNARLVVQFGSPETVLDVTTTKGEPYHQVFYLPKNGLVVLDTNFFHQFSLLLRLYDRAKPVAQPFNVFIPQEALPGTINLKYLSRESVPVGETTQELDHFQAVTDELEIEIWATPEGAIQHLSIPQANLEVVRQ